MVIGILLSGCDVQVDESSVAKIIEEDPSFKDVLAKKGELDGKINTLLTQLKQLKETADANIRAIQENFNKDRNDIDRKITVLKKELDPQRAKIREEIDVLKVDISSKRAVLKNLESTKRGLLNLVNQQKAVNTTDKDMAKWKERLADLDGQIDPLLGEIRELEEKVKILKVKLIALRQ